MRLEVACKPEIVSKRNLTNKNNPHLFLGFTLMALAVAVQTKGLGLRLVAAM